MISDPRAFIEANLHVRPAPGVPEIRLYAAHPASRLSRIAGDVSPYWAYGWAGGTVLARYLLDTPHIAKGKHVLDLGTGSGIAAIAAALTGAAEIQAIDIDPNAIAATQLNAELNGVAIATRCADILDDPAPGADLILIGDVFYDEAVARRVLPFARRCRDAGCDVLIGDPGRKPLPVDALQRIATFPVPDFGDVAGNLLSDSGVYLLK
ncbi:class I SAM-dependent methyltransferase [Asticcacaulis solisilvae]|uniref:class I SAM-dependent methyltransferase n=1 Tax=Asticcacaulis solisilvae TaxID=1217274 RepID=UPI003FD72769